MYTIYITEVALDAACTDNGVPAGQCIDPLAECRDDSGSKCLCTAANFKGDSGCEASKFDSKLCILYLKITLINVIPPNSITKIVYILRYTKCII